MPEQLYQNAIGTDDSALGAALDVTVTPPLMQFLRSCLDGR
ncbi:MAG: hypothetical protein ACK58U_05500 [Rubrivivax sp.]|jgi:hypothetical protein